MSLTDLRIKSAKPKDKPYKLADGVGLYVEVMPSGAKYFRMKYRYGGKEKRLALGVYDEVSLKEAREKAGNARSLLRNNIDPGVARQAEKASRAGENSFEAIAREWHAKYLHTWTTKHGQAILRRLEQNIFPWLGSRPVSQIAPMEVLTCLRRMEARGAIETAHRVHSVCVQVFRYAIVTSRLERNPALDVKGSIPPPQKRHFPTITDPVEVGGLLRAMEAYEGSLPVKTALQLAPMLFVRPGELRHAEWAEFDLEKAVWRIPAAKMKMREVHIVPLPRQAVELIRELQPLTGVGGAAKYLFPSIRTLAKPMSDNTLLAALRRMNYPKEVLVTHGFRAMASTLLNEQGWKPDAIERQLSHSERNKVRASYNYAEYLPERQKMMQAWADYLEGLKEGGKIIEGNFRRAG